VLQLEQIVCADIDGNPGRFRWKPLLWLHILLYHFLASCSLKMMLGGDSAPTLVPTPLGGAWQPLSRACAEPAGSIRGVGWLYARGDV